MMKEIMIIKIEEIIEAIEEDLEEDSSSTTSTICKYLYYFIQAIENTPEIKYMLAYIAKTTGFITADEFVFDADNQFAFESIFYSAMLMYTNRSASREKLIAA